MSANGGLAEVDESHIKPSYQIINHKLAISQTNPNLKFQKQIN